MKESRYVVVEKECCGTCIHYRQHYILQEGGRPYPLWYGHCGTPRMKRRDPDEVCSYWSPVIPPTPPDEDGDWYPPKGNGPLILR